MPLEITFVTQYISCNVDSIVSSANMKSEDRASSLWSHAVRTAALKDKVSFYIL